MDVCAEEELDVGVIVARLKAGKIQGMADFNLNVPVDNMQISEDIHLLFNHLITYVLNSTNKDYHCDY